MKIKCLVVDDEPLAIKLLEKHISKIDALEIVATCNNAIKAFEILNTQEVDLLFLDIKMPNLTGIDFLKTLKNPPKTIFTTAYRDYAIESYDLGVIDYLLKPITFERFFKAVDRYLGDQKKQSQSIQYKEKETDDFMLVKSGNKHHKVVINDILFIESLKDYIKIHTVDNKRIVSKYRISEIEQELKEVNFLRVHRSYIININKISAFTVNDIEVNSTEIPIGASYKEKVISFLNNWK
ncbi:MULTISPECIES: LytR/AlgR family response regulator transcription factor [unclassified Tenacibaculum]|uniref:LytR/AlgR family response regulator transcription factor n=1 Tax=unclassified Tenacibaculum TaxID=2635139 RepID=UPI001F163B54|nr:MULTISPECIES: LytTR family DNA-binding domain-containing protein [unclassified Tenacibaculum]MCF2873803.1 LytTR family DNA-binding domain-containing protein [Tenacibaculum sp. Cn5-1]MCF2933959.1 LytTR family DNA-binding domain-containing protein [Tenacibaculum sp. Cn5-34]MCG7509459.1 LytTR family DNA-binding domain-containing protein [Tenacibaculum sp. Cn5-46]